MPRLGLPPRPRAQCGRDEVAEARDALEERRLDRVERRLLGGAVQPAARGRPGRRRPTRGRRAPPGSRGAARRRSRARPGGVSRSVSRGDAEDELRVGGGAVVVGAEGLRAGARGERASTPSVSHRPTAAATRPERTACHPVAAGDPDAAHRAGSPPSWRTTVASTAASAFAARHADPPALERARPADRRPGEHGGERALHDRHDADDVAAALAGASARSWMSRIANCARPSSRLLERGRLGGRRADPQRDALGLVEVALAREVDPGVDGARAGRRARSPRSRSAGPRRGARSPRGRARPTRARTSAMRGRRAIGGPGCQRRRPRRVAAAVRRRACGHRGGRAGGADWVGSRRCGVASPSRATSRSRSRARACRTASTARSPPTGRTCTSPTRSSA